MLLGMQQALTHRDSPFINFKDFDFPDGRGHGYRWVHIKRFHLPDDSPTDQDLLAALIAHPEFKDTYDGAGIRLEPRHGQWTPCPSTGRAPRRAGRPSTAPRSAPM
jgi:hypothetical protein